MKKIILLIVVIFLTNLSILAQNDQQLDNNLKKEIINTILSCFSNNYVYPDMSLIMKNSILQKYEKGDYTNYTTTSDLINQLSIDLRQISKDRHIGIRYIEKDENSVSINKHSLLSDKLVRKKKENFKFKKAEWLPGNIGYIRFDKFEDTEYASNVVASAMSFVSECDALLIDLRYNSGGEEKMVKFLASYFFSEPTLLNSRYFTTKDSLVQSWTDTSIPGKSFIDKSVYILTSPNTASAAEAFTYTLKNYNKATIVGENTRGAAHWVQYYYFPSLKIEIKLPEARPINPVTRTNWEKTGIEPDIEIEEYNAFYKAYILALEKLQESNSDSLILQELEWYKMLAKQKMEATSALILTDYCGLFDDIKFELKENHLFWKQGENEVLVLLPLSKDHFVFDDSDDYIVKFVRNEQNKVVGYQLLIKGRKENPVHKKTGELK